MDLRACPKCLAIGLTLCVCVRASWDPQLPVVEAGPHAVQLMTAGSSASVAGHVVYAPTPDWNVQPIEVLAPQRAEKTEPGIRDAKRIRVILREPAETYQDRFLAT